MTKEYVLTTHAIDRARARFGVTVDKVNEWANGLMKKAKFIGQSNESASVYASEDGEIQLIVNEEKGVIVTVHHSVRADFLRPVLEREKRKLARKYTPAIRKNELAYAEALREIADMAVNRARACNPNTRELIAGRMADKQAEAEAVVRKIERLESEWQAKKRAIELMIE